MRFVAFASVVLLSVLVSLGSSLCQAAEPSNKEKIVGTWEFVKTSGEAPPPGTTYETSFTKDGKTKSIFKVQDKTVSFEGTYTVDGETVKITSKGPDGKEMTDTVSITKLTEKELVLEQKKADGKTVTIEFKKK